MELGIIAEGLGDYAVLYNILVGILGPDLRDPIALRPRLQTDETEIGDANYKAPEPENFSSWSVVANDCKEGTLFQSFLIDNNILEEERKIIIHLDTAECELEGYDVPRPTKTKGEEKEYCQQLREAVIQQINNWLNQQYEEQLLYAICIEETEAWLLPLYEKKGSSTRPDPKKHLEKLLQKKRNTDKKFKKQYESSEKQGTRALQDFLSKAYKKEKNLKAALLHNQSLADFVQSIQECCEN